MRNVEQERCVEEGIENAHRATAVLGLVAGAVTQKRGMDILKSAHTYQYAALLADFVRAAERGDWIGPAIQMDAGTVKPTRDFLMDHMFDTLFRPLEKQRGGQEFLLEVKYKARRILDAA